MGNESTSEVYWCVREYGLCSYTEFQKKKSAIEIIPEKEFDSIETNLQ